MSERCLCWLYVSMDGPDRDADPDALKALCEDHGGVAEIEGLWCFEEMRHGVLPEPLRDWLTARGRAFAWENDAGDDYPAGVLIHRPATGSTMEFGVVDGEIALTLTELDKPGRLEAARAASFLWLEIAKRNALAEAS